jgi:hypothetical protein
MIECPKCGGDGGVDASQVMMGEQGWLSCYFCGETGFVTPAQMDSYERQEEEALEGMHSGSFPDWEDDGVWNPEDDQEGFWAAVKADGHTDGHTYRDDDQDQGWEGDGKVRDDPAFFPLTSEDIPF